MKKGFSLYHFGMGRYLLRRFWPLWLLTLLFLAYSQGLMLVYAANIQPERLLDYLRGSVWDYIEVQVLVCAASGILVAMAVFGCLGARRSFDMMASLPLRRETAFLSAYVTGLVLLLLCPAAVALLLLGVCPKDPALSRELLLWMAVIMLDLCAFFGATVFCATLTGRPYAPLLLLLFHLAPLLLRQELRLLYEALRYGYLTPESWPAWVQGLDRAVSALLPGLGLSRAMEFYYDYDPPEDVRVMLLQFRDCAAAGLALALPALWVYRRRPAENTESTLAVRALRPVFLAVMSLCGGLLLRQLVRDAFFYSYDFDYGPLSTNLALVLVPLGGVLGYYLGRFLLLRSRRIFRKSWLGLGLCMSLCLLLVLVAEKDPLGYERRVPRPEDVAWAELDSAFCGEVVLRENIPELTALHRKLIEEKPAQDVSLSGLEDYDSLRLYLHYHMKDGSRLSRTYRVLLPREDYPDKPGTLTEACAELFNSPAFLAGRLRSKVPVRRENIYSARLKLVGEYTEKSLSASQAMALYLKGILPDLREGHLFYWPEKAQRSGIERIGTLELSLRDNMQHVNDDSSWRSYDSLRIDLYIDSVHSLDWLRENLTLPEWLRESPEAEEAEAEEELVHKS